MESMLIKLYPVIIVKEWIDCGEFKGTDKIIVIGSKFYARAVKVLLSGSGKKVYYCTKAVGKYKYNNKTKWVVFDKDLKGNLPLNSYDVLLVPNFGC